MSALELKTIDPTTLFGVGDANIKLIEQSIPAKIIARGEQIKLQGKESDVLRASEVLHEMMQTLSSRGDLNKKDVQQLFAEQNQEFSAPRPIAIAHHLIRHWLANS